MQGQKSTYKYDDAGTVSYTYDACRNVLTVKEGTSIIARKYDALNRVTSCTNAKGETITYRYDFRGDLKELTYDSGRKISYTHDKAGNLIRQVEAKGSTTLRTCE